MSYVFQTSTTKLDFRLSLTIITNIYSNGPYITKLLMLTTSLLVPLPPPKRIEWSEMAHIFSN